MGVGPIRGGGGRGGAKGAGKAGKGAASNGAAGKAGGSTSGKLDRTSSLVGPSGLVGSSEVAATSVIEQAKQIARSLRNGEITNQAEATRRLVAGILKERMDIQSKALEARIAERLSEDPRIAQTLERIWQRGDA